jgi:hypothetical protein
MTTVLMAREPPSQGTIIQYPYLWASQRDAGETEGRKYRPVCLVLRIWDASRSIHHLILFPISSQPPNTDQIALEIPDTERRRAGLNRYPRAWIVVSEYNYDVAERSYYYSPNGDVLGSFSAPFLREVARSARSILSKAAARVDRTI